MWNRGPSQRRALLLAVAVGMSTSVASAQNIVAPSSHWGALMYPELAPSQQIGANFILFSEFAADVSDGEDVDPGEGERNRYNFERESIGFNLLTMSHTRALKRDSAYFSNVLYRATAMLGVTADQPTEWFQNEVIHDVAHIPHVPREQVRDCDDGILRCLQLGYSGELNYQVYSLTRTRAGLVMLPTPLFVGAGFSLSTIQQEAFTQTGVRDFDLKLLDFVVPRSWVFVTFSAMTRTGVLLPSVTFRHLSSYYLSAQGSMALHVAKYAFPIILEMAVTGTSGTFIQEKPPDDTGLLPPSNNLRELYWGLRANIGDFTFETFNDQLGGKDKGPSYGARIFYTVNPASYVWGVTNWL